MSWICFKKVKIIFILLTLYFAVMYLFNVDVELWSVVVVELWVVESVVGLDSTVHNLAAAVLNECCDYEQFVLSLIFAATALYEISLRV